MPLMAMNAAPNYRPYLGVLGDVADLSKSESLKALNDGLSLGAKATLAYYNADSVMSDLVSAIYNNGYIVSSASPSDVDSIQGVISRDALTNIASKVLSNPLPSAPSKPNPLNDPDTIKSMVDGVIKASTDGDVRYVIHKNAPAPAPKPVQRAQEQAPQTSSAPSADLSQDAKNDINIIIAAAQSQRANIAKIKKVMQVDDATKSDLNVVDGDLLKIVNGFNDNLTGKSKRLLDPDNRAQAVVDARHLIDDVYAPNIKRLLDKSLMPDVYTKIANASKKEAAAKKDSSSGSSTDTTTKSSGGGGGDTTRMSTKDALRAKLTDKLQAANKSASGGGGGGGGSSGGGAFQSFVDFLKSAAGMATEATALQSEVQKGKQAKKDVKKQGGKGGAGGGKAPEFDYLKWGLVALGVAALGTAVFLIVRKSGAAKKPAKTAKNPKRKKASRKRRSRKA